MSFVFEIITPSQDVETCQVEVRRPATHRMIPVVKSTIKDE